MSFRLGFVAIVAAALCAAACSSKKSSKEQTGKAPPAAPADPRVAAILATSKQLRDKACACTDGTCTGAVRAEHDAWLKTQIDEYAKLGEPTSTKEQEKEAAAVQGELFRCLEKPHFQTATPPAATPPTATPPAATPPAATP